jgi:hypothetical protein
MSPNQNWQSLGAGGLYGYNNQGGVGGAVARSELDQLRIGTARTPEAEYPDGFLGTIRSRRDDRLLDSVKNRVGDKAYDRGVHAGERQDPSAYLWSTEFSDRDGIRRQSRARAVEENGVTVYRVPKNAPDPRLAPPPHLVNDGKANTLANEPVELNAARAAQLRYLRPTWS